jgi:hypothetical protein
LTPALPSQKLGGLTALAEALNMRANITDADLTESERLSHAAAPGPWEVDHTKIEVESYAVIHATGTVCLESEERRPRWLALLALLALGCSTGVPPGETAPATDPEKAKPLPKDVVDAWEAAGCSFGRIEVNSNGYIHYDAEDMYKLSDGKLAELSSGQVPAFGFGAPGHDEKPLERLAKLPVPPSAFGLSLHYLGREGWPKGLPNMETLHALQLEGSTVTDVDLKNVARLESLLTLAIHSPDVTDRGVEYLAALKNLRALNLIQAKVTDAGLKRLAALANLEVLWIHGGHVTDAALKSLSRLTRLRALCVSGDQITDAGIPDLAALRNLRYLTLAETRVTQAGMDELKNAMPECEIGR